jgi:hypothetical protein
VLKTKRRYPQPQSANELQKAVLAPPGFDKALQMLKKRIATTIVRTTVAQKDDALKRAMIPKAKIAMSSRSLVSVNRIAAAPFHAAYRPRSPGWRTNGVKVAKPET